MHVINHPDICTCRCRNIIYDKFPGQSVNSCLRNFDWGLYLVWAFDSDTILCGSEQKIRKITQEDRVIFSHLNQQCIRLFCTLYQFFSRGQNHLSAMHKPHTVTWQSSYKPHLKCNGTT